MIVKCRVSCEVKSIASRKGIGNSLWDVSYLQPITHYL
jgi:hypothetical protein